MSRETDGRTDRTATAIIMRVAVNAIAQ